MHISFLTPEYPHAKVAHAAGIGTSIKNLVDELIKNNHQVTLFIYGQETDNYFVENNINFHIIKQKRYQFATWFFYRKFIQKYINKIVKNSNIDLLEAADWTGITAFMKIICPVFIRFHGSDTYFCNLENRKQKLKNFWFEKLAVSNANACIAPTQFAGQLSQKIFNLKNKKIVTIHYGLELEAFTNNNQAVFQKDLILYVGTIIRKKGVLELPEIFANVVKKRPNAQLLLIGADANDIFTKAQSTWDVFKKKTNIDALKNVTYLGKIPYQEIQKHIQQANVCVFPTFAETLGMVTVEAMAMQKPVVSSDFGWTNEIIINGESGFLVNPKKHHDFADAIIKILNDNDLALKIGKNARKRVESNFDIATIVQQNIAFYQSIINSK